jgi:voltage-gated potassium channel
MLLFTVFAGTILFYLLEHGINPGVHTIWDSMWFTITTMLTGNSNINPVTHDGEVIAVLMIIMGISFVGILTASLASWLIKKSNKTENDIEEERLKNIENSMDEIKNEIIELKDLLRDKL